MTWGFTYFTHPAGYLGELVSLVHDYILMFLVRILLLVLLSLWGSIVYSCFDRQYWEDEDLEFLWTIVPFIVLSFIAVPSLIRLFFIESCTFCGLTFKIIGHQWYWRYFSSDFSDYYFDSYIILGCENRVRLLEVDNELFLPAGIPVRMMVSSSDVLHSWTVPSWGFKVDAIPGRLRQICPLLDKVGKFYGQCSEICGVNHRFIPIVVVSLPFSTFFAMFS